MRQHILVVEDEVRLHKNLLRSLQRAGFAVIGVADGSAVWPVLRALAVDLVLLDLGLPDTDGLTVLHHVHVRYPHLPIVVMTGQASRELEPQAYQLGARAFFSKPLALAQLQETIRAILQGLAESPRLVH
jgi:DNA-binding NtrC family response regulator